MNDKSSRLTQLVVLTLSFIVLAAFSLFVHMISPVSPGKQWKEVHIPEGSTYRECLGILEENGIIDGPFTLLLLGKLTGSDTELKAGYYNLSASLSPLQIFEKLIEGRTIQFSIMIPEGATLKEIKRKFRKTGLIDDKAWDLVRDENFLSSFGINAPSLEGYIFPDTYKFPKGTDPEVIFKIMVQRLETVFDSSMMKRAAEIGITRHQVLTLASIIEKEAVFDDERPLISAVYHNRLKKGMKLQADPTVLYGVEQKWIRIRYRDLRRDTPYNTYVIKGLPPGPIASPGLKSIEAALYPAEVNYLYFVSKNDGTHYFSETGREHLKAVSLYQLDKDQKSD